MNDLEAVGWIRVKPEEFMEQRYKEEMNLV